jgi:UDP-glucose 4-epimerase
MKMASTQVALVLVFRVSPRYSMRVRILVTGGLGFIGSHLTKKLISDGFDVTVLDDCSTGSLSNLKPVIDSDRLRVVNDSVLNFELLESLIVESDYVFHLAAAVGVFNIVNHPLKSLLTNIRGTENVLEAAQKKGIPVFLTSSSEVYGKNTANSLKETDDRVLGSPVMLRWSYSEAKAIDESLAFAYHVEHGLETRIVRFFNTVGPRQVGNYGMVIPRFVKSAIKNETLTIYGDGNQKRCFAHVYDVIDAVIAIAFAQNTVGKVINIGNTDEISIKHLAELVIKETGSTSKIAYISYAEAYGEGFEDMERRVPNIDLIRDLVGWVPTRNLSTIIGDIAQEMKENLKS